MKIRPEIDLSKYPKTTQAFIRPLLETAWAEGWYAPDESRDEDNPYTRENLAEALPHMAPTTTKESN